MTPAEQKSYDDLLAKSLAYKARIDKLEAALREMMSWGCPCRQCEIARNALKD